MKLTFSHPLYDFDDLNQKDYKKSILSLIKKSMGGKHVEALRQVEINTEYWSQIV